MIIGTEQVIPVYGAMCFYLTSDRYAFASWKYAVKINFGAFVVILTLLMTKSFPY